MPRIHVADMNEGPPSCLLAGSARVRWLHHTNRGEPTAHRESGPLMGQYTLDSRHAGVVALDQHARSVALCGIRLDTAEVRSTRLVGCPSASDISGWALAWVGAPVRFVYESGPCGFQLARDLRGAGLDCDVIAVSSIPRSASDRAFKDDRRDARALLEAVVAPSSRCRAVYVPSEEAEAARDMVRAHQDASAATRRLKKQLSAMLLRHGHVWDERTASGPSGRPGRETTSPGSGPSSSPMYSLT